MELNIRLEKHSISLPVKNPFQLDLDSLVNQIETFVVSKGDGLSGMDVRGLLPRMVKGIAGCEAGCPADAKGLVSRGFQNFSMEYVEGGILAAKATTKAGNSFVLRMFPDF